MKFKLRRYRNAVVLPCRWLLKRKIDPLIDFYNFRLRPERFLNTVCTGLPDLRLPDLKLRDLNGFSLTRGMIRTGVPTK